MLLERPIVVLYSLALIEKARAYHVTEDGAVEKGLLFSGKVKSVLN